MLSMDTWLINDMPWPGPAGRIQSSPQRSLPPIRGSTREVKKKKHQTVQQDTKNKQNKWYQSSLVGP